MKKILLVISISLIMVMLGGCVSVPTLSEEQGNKIANFSTALLLKYDANYKTRLVDTAAIEAERAIIEAEEIKKQEEEEAIQAAIDAEAIENEPIKPIVEEDVYVDIASVLGLQGVDLEYSYFEIVTKYPGEDATAFAPVMNSTDGNYLLVVHFTLTNLLESSNEVSVYNTNASFKLGINQLNQKNVFMTLLLNDFAYYEGKMDPGQMEDLVLISEIKETESMDIQNLSLSIKVNEESIKTKLQ